MSPRELGFIGLGVMGYPMALNLLKKLDEGARLHVYDVDERALKKFEQEAPTKVHVCANAREVAESSVRTEYPQECNDTIG
jgi:3-hydroxyisobutyrate dehydrogenase